MDDDLKSVDIQELKERSCPYLKYCVKKQLPPPPSYSSEIYQEEIFKDQYQFLENLIFNSKSSTDIITQLKVLYFHEVDLNREIDKDYESRETIVPKSKFEKFIWNLVNNHFQQLTSEDLYPIPKHVIESQKRKDKILNPIYSIIGLGILLFWIWMMIRGIFFN